MKIFITITLLCFTFLNAQNVPNGGFENWTDDVLDDWNTSNEEDASIITKTTDAFSGSFAVRGQSMEGIFDNKIVLLEAVGPPDSNRAGFPISESFTSLTFQYKYDNGQNDRFDINVTIKDTEKQTIGGGNLTITANSPDWTLATVNIALASGTPGSALVSFTMYNSRADGPPSTDAFFIIDDVELSTVTDINDDNKSTPTQYSLIQNYPNPFNPSTTIKYDLPEAGNVTLKIYNAAGEEVVTLFSGYQNAGRKSVEWNGRDVSGNSISSGVYFYRLEAAGYTASRKMVLLK